MSGAGEKKVVVIGLSKTGTTTLKDMLQSLGYDVCGPRKKLLKDVRNNQLKAIDSTVEKYSAFEDWPWPLTYKYLYNKSPDGFLFILTTRHSTEKWLSSIKNHGRRKSVFKSMVDTYGYYKPYGREKEFCAVYESHNADVRDFFRNKENVFLDFCLEHGDGWEKLCAFLGTPDPNLSVPHRNKTTDNKRILNRVANGLVNPFYRLYCLLSRT
jgi:hypothetical protein